MQIASFSEARESFKAVLDRVEADADVTLITRRHAQGAVVMSLDTYNSLMETVHLLRSPANAAHLQRSLEQAERVGIGKPEPLRENLSGCWSRRIDDEHRLFYRLEGTTLVILACRYHYR
jgi:antitoxin YefM